MVVEGKARRNDVGGAWVDASSGESFESIDPATRELIGVSPASTADDIDRPVGAAKAAWEQWSRVPAPKRAELLFRVAHRPEERKGQADRADGARDGEAARRR